MDIFTLEEIKKAPESLKVPIPPCNLSKFIQDKAVKVLSMVEYCEKMPASAHNNAGATQKLKAFIDHHRGRLGGVCESACEAGRAGQMTFRPLA